MPLQSQHHYGSGAPPPALAQRNPTMDSTIATYETLPPPPAPVHPPVTRAATYATLGTAEAGHGYRPLPAAPTVVTAPTAPPTLATRDTRGTTAPLDAEHDRRRLLRVRRPPCRFPAKPSLPSKLAGPIQTKAKLRPGRLFVRLPPTGNGEADDDLAFRLGEYCIHIRRTEIDARVVEQARKKVEKRAARSPRASEGKGARVYGAGCVLEQRDDLETAAAEAARPPEALTEAEAPKLPSLCIEHTSPATGETKTIWSSAPGINFVSAAALSSLEVHPDGAMIERFHRTYAIQTIDQILRGPAHVVTIVGQLGHAIVDGGLDEESPWYALSFEALEESRALRFALQVEGGQIADGYDCTANLVQMSILANDVDGTAEAFFGLGARTSAPNLRGQEISVCHPSGAARNAMRHSPRHPPGHATVPHVVSSNGVSLHLHNVEPSTFDFTPANGYSIRVPCSQLGGTFLAGDTILNALELHTAMTGRASLPPRWIHRGAIAGTSGGTAAVRRTLRRLFQFRVPLAGVLVGDWTGPKPATHAGRGGGRNASWHNYVLEREHYPGWGALVDALERRGVGVGVQIAPCLEEIPPCLRSGRRHLFGEAEGEYFVKERAGATEGDGAPTSTAGPAMHSHFRKAKCGTLDLTHPDAAAWFKRAIQEEVLDRASASFYLADAATGGPPLDGTYARHPNDGLSYHNAYAEEWARTNRAAIREAGRDGDCFVVTNGAHGATAKYAGATALLDRAAAFGSDGGETLRAVLNGILNGGFSGLTLAHCAVGTVVPRRLRSAVGTALDGKSREMLCRWMEMTAFTSLFRTHDSGDAHAGGTISAYDDEGALKAMARWAKVYAALADYRSSVLREASFQGLPVVRHPLLHFPSDAHFRGTKGDASPAFMLGESVYVVPVLKSGVAKKKVHLPAGDWIHLWSAEEVAGPHSIGKVVEVACPVGEPPVFVRNTDAMHRFVEALKQKRVTDVKKRAKGKSRLFSSFRRK
ncbi:hypothetical protein ACHAXT_002045 [Thalassiosira profunda]